MSEYKVEYPKIALSNKADLARRIAHNNFPRKDALALINDVIKNHLKYWHDTPDSDPVKEKYVRSAKYTPLGRLLKLIDHILLARHDKLLPRFIYGGVTSRSHMDAAKALTGNRKHRTLLAMDIQRFFEQITEKRVEHFFHNKAQCPNKGAKILAQLCCVLEGSKKNPATRRTLARGFATSSRLSIWTNIELFYSIDRLVKQRLKAFDPRFVLFVDDIGITASRVPTNLLASLGLEIQKLMTLSDPNQSLPLNATKTRITKWDGNMQHLGLKIGRKRVSIGAKTQSKNTIVIKRLQKTTSPQGRKSLLQQKRGIKNYKNQLSRLNKGSTKK